MHYCYFQWLFVWNGVFSLTLALANCLMNALSQNSEMAKRRKTLIAEFYSFNIKMKPLWRNSFFEYKTRYMLDQITISKSFLGFASLSYLASPLSVVVFSFSLASLHNVSLAPIGSLTLHQLSSLAFRNFVQIWGLFLWLWLVYWPRFNKVHWHLEPFIKTEIFTFKLVLWLFFKDHNLERS